MASAVGLFLVLGLVASSPVFAWDLSKSTNGVTINKEPSDTSTQTVTVTLFWDYKGGSSWVTSYTPSYTSSYASTKWVCNIDGNDADAIEIDLNPTGGRCQMVQVAQGSTYRKFAVLNEPLRVSITPSGTLPVAVSNVPTVAVESMPSTVSVSGTLPVDVVGSSVFGDRTSIPYGLAVLWLVCGGVLSGYSLIRARS